MNEESNNLKFEIYNQDQLGLSMTEIDITTAILPFFF